MWRCIRGRRDRYAEKFEPKKREACCPMKIIYIVIVISIIVIDRYPDYEKSFEGIFQ